MAELGGSPDSFRLTKVVDFVRYIVRRHDVEASKIYEDMKLNAGNKNEPYSDDCVRDILHGFVPIVGII